MIQYFIFTILIYFSFLFVIILIANIYVLNFNNLNLFYLLRPDTTHYQAHPKFSLVISRVLLGCVSICQDQVLKVTLFYIYVYVQVSIASMFVIYIYIYIYNIYIYIYICMYVCMYIYISPSTSSFLLRGQHFSK